jgi:hypothetical protein
MHSPKGLPRGKGQTLNVSAYLLIFVFNVLVDFKFRHFVKWA